MEVAITEFRAALRAYVEQARRGHDVVLTERGVPVARLVAIDAAPLLEQLEREGALSPAPQASRRASGRRRAKATGSVSELVTELRR